MLISKFMTSKLGTYIIAIHMLPNVSGSKDSQTKKFDQLIERNMRTFVLEYHSQNEVDKLFPDLFIKN